MAKKFRGRVDAEKLYVDGEEVVGGGVGGGGEGTVVGPEGATANAIVLFDGTTGELVKDSETLLADLGDLFGPASSADNRIAVYDGITGKLLKDSGYTIADIAPTESQIRTALAGATGALSLNNQNITNVGTVGGVTLGNLPSMAATATSGNLIQSSGSRALADAAVAVSNLATMASGAGASGRVITSASTDKTLQDSGTLLSNIPTMASAASGTGKVLTSAGADKTIQDGGVLLSNIPTQAAAGTSGNLLKSAASDKTQSDSGIAAANVVTAASNYASGRLIQSAGADKTTSDSGIATANVVTASANASAAKQYIVSAGADKTVQAVTADGLWKRVLHTNFVTNSSQTLSADGNVSIHDDIAAGNLTWTHFNQANGVADGSDDDILNGTGYRTKAGNSAAWSAGTYTWPGLEIAISSFYPAFSERTALRIWCYSSDLGTDSASYGCFGIWTGRASSGECHLMQWKGDASGTDKLGCFFVKGNTRSTTSETLAHGASNRVGMLEVPGVWMFGRPLVSRYGADASGFPAASTLTPLTATVLETTETTTNNAFVGMGGLGVGAASNWKLAITAGRDAANATVIWTVYTIAVDVLEMPFT